MQKEASYSKKDPLLPGAYFGAVLGIGIRLWVSRSIFDLLLIVVCTTAAWFAAFHAAIHAQEEIGATLCTIAQQPVDVLKVNYAMALCGLIAGLVGSSLLSLSLFFINRASWEFPKWSQTILAGTIFGTLLELGVSDESLPIHVGSFLPLFSVGKSRKQPR